MSFNGQGKLPGDVVGDNALRKRKYENDELLGDQPVIGSKIAAGTPIKFMVSCTQAEYDALAVKQANTLYVVVG